MGQIRVGRSEREEMKRVSDEYLLSIRHRITGRDMKILELLLAHPLLNSYHIYTLTEGIGKVQPFHKLSKGQQLANDRLRVLFDNHLIHKESPRLPPGQGTSKQYVWLDRGGIRMLGSDKEHRSTLPVDYLHTSLIMDVYCRMVEWDRENKLDLFVLEREVKQEWPLVPDLILLFRYNQRGYLYFVEVDRCEKATKLERARIRSYREWMLSNAWHKEPWANILPKPQFPVVLYLFDEAKPVWRKRKRDLERCAADCLLPFKAMGASEFLDRFLETLRS